MKTTPLKRFLGMNLSFAVLAVAALVSCSNPALGSVAPAVGPAGGAPDLSLTLAWKAGGERSIRPTSYPTPSTYDIVLYPASGSDVTRSGVTTTTCTFVGLAAVVYTVTVSGKDSGGNVIVSGVGSADMRTTAMVNSTITLSYSSTGIGAGQIHLTFAGGMAVDSTSLTLVDPSGAVTSNALLTGSSPTFAYANSSAATGSWKMFLTFVSGATTAMKLDTVLVLRNVDTAATVTIAATDFNATYVPVSGLALNASTMALTVGGATGSLAATLSPGAASNSLVTWTSTDTSVAGVDQNGLVTPVYAGTATVTATSVDHRAATASCAVTVRSTYGVTYAANGATDGTTPAMQTKIQGTGLALAANTGNLARTGHTFAGWNTEADGSGTSYATGANYSADVALALYAKWNVGKSSSATTLASGLNPSTFGSGITFTATVVPANATGTVTFKDGGTTLGTGEVGDGTATFCASGLSVDDHGITAEYSGDGYFNASASVTLMQTVWSTAAKDGLWSDPTTWSCGSVPGAGTNVTIGTGITITLDTNTAVLGNLTILGTLTVSSAQVITLAGTFTNNGTFNPGTGYVLSAPGTPGAPSTATFMEAGVKFVFPAGLPQNSLSLRQAPLASISDNFMMYSFRTTVVNQYYLIRSTASITGAFTLVIDYSAIMTSLTTSQINAVAFKSRQDSGSPWTDITLSGATITNRYTDGMKGKFTIEWSWPSCFNF